MTERERFEAWVRSRGGSVMKRNGEYIESMTRLWDECWQAARTVPDTHVLLPKEPSEAMIDAFNDAHHRADFREESYRAMIEAASQGSGE